MSNSSWHMSSVFLQGVLNGSRAVFGEKRLHFLATSVLNHLEERLLNQAQAQVLYTPLFGVVRVAYPDAWFLTLTPYKIIILGPKRIPQ